MQIYLAAIRVFPIKSLDGVALQECRVLPSGSLEHDRHMALFDASGKIINAKEHPAIHSLRAAFDPTNCTVCLSRNGHPKTKFHLDDEHVALTKWLSDYFRFPITLQRNTEHGFPDDLESPGPTVISTATLQAVATWFSISQTDDVRRRFRANLELGGDVPFWEDHLCQDQADVHFRIGDVEFWGTNPCQRCAVPTRSPDTGEPNPGFARKFSELRQQSLPNWAPHSRFDHYYRLAVNTRLAALKSARLRVGDEVKLLH